MTTETNNAFNATFPSPSVLVRTFHETYNQPVRTTPEACVPEQQLRVKLILEEASELYEANAANDFIEVVDALADLIYVVYGAGLTHGLDLDAAFGGQPLSPQPVIRNLLKKARVKPRPTPALEGFRRNSIIAGINKQAVKFAKASEANDIEEMRKVLVSIISACYSAALYFGVDLDRVLAEVQRSNMSKLGLDGKPIFRAEDNKVLKGPNFSQPDIQTVLDKQPRLR